MPVVITLGFTGQTEAALKHYEDALGAEVLFLMRFRDAPDSTFTRPGIEDLIFHATFRVFDTIIEASDVGYEGPESKPTFAGFALLIKVKSADAAKRAFAALAEGGHVVVPFAESKFTAWYGVVTDRFGVSWKLNVESNDA
ncbi:MAG: VOC family protein [Planctomycetota bacterium]